MKIIKITNTCFACPSQWEAFTDDKFPIYIRYRWGYLSVRLGQQNSSISSAVGGDEIFGKQLADDLDGTLEYSKLKEILKGKIEFPEYENN